MAPVWTRVLLIIVASALLQTATTASINDTIFAVTVSSRLKAAAPQTLCAQVHGPSEPVVLTVTLETETKSSTLLEETIEEDFYRCITFEAPVVSRGTVASVNVTIQGESGTLSKKAKVLIEPATFIHIIQTDKPIYKPGQTVHFRVTSIDANFIPVKRVYKVIELEDPRGNRIAQWLNKTVDGGILDLSHPIIPEALQGTYTITATTEQDEQTQHRFDIKEYVLPKYEVKAQLPSVISILDTEADFKVCGKYTYGKPVIGSVKAVLCRKAYRWYGSNNQDVCKTFQLTTDKSGCTSHTVNLSEYFLYKSGYHDSFQLEVELQEFGTGVTLKGSARTSFTYDIRTVTFEDEPASYKPGIAFEGKVKLVGPDSKPVANENVYIRANKENVTVVTDNKGMASFSLDTSLWNNSISIHASSLEPGKRESSYVHNLRSPEYRPAVVVVSPFYSKSNSFLKIKQNEGKFRCNKEGAIRAEYIIQGKELKEGQETLDFFYLVMSKGSIVQHDRISEAVKKNMVNKGVLTIPLRQVIKLAPVAQVVVYTVMPSGEAVADSKDFPIQMCLSNKVSLKFASLQQLPAERTTLSLQAHPDSLCSVRAIDQSVLLLKSGVELTVDYVFDQLPFQKLSGYPYVVEDNEPYPCFPIPVPVEEPEIEELEAGNRKKRSFYFGPVHHKDDVFSIFKTHWLCECGEDRPGHHHKMGGGCFCVSSAGLGIAPNTGLTAFQPFFVSLTLPYSVIRGEVFTLRATVFNYLTKCIMVKVTLAESDQFTFRPCDSCLYTVCLCGEESSTFSWVVTPNTLGEVSIRVSAEALKTDQLCGNEVATVPEMGQIDTVIRTLLVQAEGTPQMVSHNALLCPADGPVEKMISLLMPEMFVAGSARAKVSVLGDLMGRAMKNLDKLLEMPYGCGEQNMVKFAPNIFILNYLKSTGQLSNDILDRATEFLQSGYQRELTYKHDDGSYSAFGKSDKSGNTWLTAFVMKSFGGARPYIFVQPEHIIQAKTWLWSHQRPDGCITSVGSLLNNDMKGGVDSDVSLTAYITAALLELDLSGTNQMVQKCLECLRAALASDMDNLHTTALLAYTFTLAGDQQTRTKLITLLHQKSKTEGGMRFWDREVEMKYLDSVEVETTSYVLLALMSGPLLPEFGLDYSASIVRWLAQQQNPYGGFSSTQDTVVALQALAKYGAATYSEQGSTAVRVTSLGGLSTDFTVDQSSRLLFQEKNLPEVPGEYTVRAEGQGCVLAQISMHYNIPPPPDFSSFNLTTSTMSKCNVSRPQLILFVNVRYQGRREETNMVIINIKLLSGYVLDKSSLDMMKGDQSVKRVDVDDGFINIYLEGLKKDNMRIYSVTIEQDQAVRNLKPAVVKVYDYYQTSDEAVTEYTSPCAESDTVNEL
ncbi:hypothetical protein WMY93_029341 [Mugilogobius chulae]|uniref:Alpha-2-macroglobulin n=1 Tax=Mugilogobius chulae TaxID=88201 RepID=A0AAW0MVK7_9GOBI